MKKIIISIAVIVMVICIYIKYIDQKIYYLALGDSLAYGINSYNVKEYGYSDYISDYLLNNSSLNEYHNLASPGYRTTDLINDIKENKKFNNLHIQNALIKADIVTISIGLNDLLYILSIDKNDINIYIDDLIIDLDELFKLIKQYCKEKVIVTNYYHPTDNNIAISYLNSRLKELTTKYKFNYMDINEIVSNIFLNDPNSIHPSTEGYIKIGEKIINNYNL